MVGKCCVHELCRVSVMSKSPAKSLYVATKSIHVELLSHRSQLHVEFLLSPAKYRPSCRTNNSRKQPNDLQEHNIISDEDHRLSLALGHLLIIFNAGPFI